MQKILADIETYTNVFMLGCKNYITKEKFSFLISKEADDRTELFKFLSSYKGFWITFNGIHYDNMVLAYGQKHKWWPNESCENVCLKLKLFSDQIINDDESNFDRLKPYKYFNWSFTNIDLFLYWSKMLRQSKKIGLKGLGIQLGYPVVQELPFDPDSILDAQQIDELKIYNLEHDLGILDLLVQAFEGNSKISIGNLGTIQLRDQVVKQYNISAYSMDAPKIASEVLLKGYCEKTNKDPNFVRNLRFERPQIEFSKLFKDLNVSFELPELKKMFLLWNNSINTFEHSFISGTPNHPIKISVGVGGIHTIQSNEIFESTDTEVILTSDIAAMYPTNIENWNAFRFPEVLETYKSFKTRRIEETKPGLKSTKKGSSEWMNFFQQDQFYKLVLNGVSGLLDMEYSWLYNPEGIMKVRCGGQLILLSLLELCIKNNIDVISMNTDGIEVRLSRDKIDLYYSLIRQVELKFNVQFESEQYKKIIYQNVNSYLAVTETGLKKKGATFLTNPDLGNSTDFLVIPKLLEFYFVKNISPEVVLENPEEYGLTIFDFCASQKTDRSYTVEWMGQKQQRLNRYYVSRKGGYLYKCRWIEKKDPKTKNSINTYTKAHMLKDWGVQLYNNHEQKPLSQYNIDKRYYLAEVNKIIHELQPKPKLC